MKYKFKIKKGSTVKVDGGLGIPYTIKSDVIVEGCRPPEESKYVEIEPINYYLKMWNHLQT